MLLVQKCGYHSGRIFCLNYEIKLKFLPSPVHSTIQISQAKSFRHKLNLLQFSNNGKEGIWTNYYTGNAVDINIGVTASGLSGNPNQNCGVLIVPRKGWVDWICKVPRAHPWTCVCEHPGQMYLQLRGLCPSSYIDKFYVPRNQKRSGAILLLGLDTTSIEYDKQLVSWKLTQYSHKTSALSTAGLSSYVLGSHEWLIENDNVDCSVQGKPYKRVLKLTGCKEDEFTCSDGQCIRNCLYALYSLEN